MKEVIVYVLAVSEAIFYMVLIVLVVKLLLVKSKKKSYMLWAKLSYRGNIYTPIVTYPSEETDSIDVRHWIEIEKKRLVAEHSSVIPSADQIDVLDIKVIKV